MPSFLPIVQMGALLLLLCSGHGAIVALSGAGSSFPAPVMPAQFDAWKLSSVYTKLYSGSSLSYSTPDKDNSDFAVTQLALKTIQFVATDIALNASSINALKAASGNRYY